MPDRFLTYYVSRVVDLPPLVAQAAFDAQFVGGRTATCGTAGAGCCRLELSATASVTASHRSACHRVMPGTLRAGVRHMRVDLELWPWSSRAVEVGLQPRNRGRPPSQPLLSAGHEVLARVGTLLHAWADLPLARLAEPSRGPRRRGAGLTLPRTSGGTRA